MRPLPLLVLLFTLTFVGSSFVTPFDGFDSGQLPIPQEDPPIQPAGWAFSIWIVIFAWLLASAAFGIRKRAGDVDWDRVRGPLLVSLVLGTPWLYVAERSAEAATALIGFMAATAIVAFLRAPARDRWLLSVPVGLYAGWLTAATVVAFAATMAGHGLATDGLGWAYVGIPLAVAVAVAVQWRKPLEPAYGAAVAWALFGIAAKNGGAHPGVTILAGLGLVAVLGTALRRGRRSASG